MSESVPPDDSGNEQNVPGFDKFGAVEPDAKSLKERIAYEKGSEQRREERKQAAHWISIFVLRLFAITLCIVFLVRIYHLLTPHSWCWLDDDQLQTIDYLLFSGVIGGNLKQIFGAED
jgi:hypothetical protein